jgi:hypothetical protein
MRKIFILAIGLLTSACASDVANRVYVSKVFPERDPASVEVLWEKPKREFIVIADFQSRGETPDDLRLKAAKIGADAVLVAVIGGLYSRTEQWAGRDKMTGATNHYSGHIVGTAVVYK